MDVRKHLRGLGWGGDGHALGKTGTGIKKPLLISHKRNSHGLGAKSQKESQADQWWLNAFDNALKDIGTGKESTLSKVKDAGGKGSLYGFFVRGQPMEGTIGVEEETSGASTPCEETKTSVLVSVKDLNEVERAEKRARKEARRAKREQKRKRDEDPVDSHQDEPEAKKSKESSAASSDVETSAKTQDRKKKSSSRKNIQLAQPLIEIAPAQPASKSTEENIDWLAGFSDIGEVQVIKKKKKRPKQILPAIDAEDTQHEAAMIKPAPDVVPASIVSDKEARKKARAEKRARKEERRKAREESAVPA